MALGRRQSISFSTWLDFEVSWPGERLSIIKQAQRQYERVAAFPGGRRFPARMYKPLTSRIFELERSGESGEQLSAWIDGLGDSWVQMKPSLHAVLRGYLKWRQTHRVEVLAVNPPQFEYFHHGFRFTGQPDADVLIDGRPLRVVLYCKDGKPPKRSLATPLGLLDRVTAPSRPEGMGVAILDARSARLHRNVGLPSDIQTAVDLSLDMFVTMWRRLLQHTRMRRTA